MPTRLVRLLLQRRLRWSLTSPQDVAPPSVRLSIAKPWQAHEHQGASLRRESAFPQCGMSGKPPTLMLARPRVATHSPCL